MGSRESIRDTLDGKGATGWLVVQVIVWLVGVSTLSFALSTVEEIKVEYEGIFDLVEVVTVGIFSVEYIFRVWVADSYFYIFEPIAIVDLLSILPSWIDSVLPGDQFPALQFLRMLRIFKFIAQSQRGGEAVKAFRKSWDDNSSLLLAASLAGGAVWLVTAALQYLTEKDNSDMDWCYPPVGVPATDAINCECDDDGCEGTGCTCEPRFSSIPSAMFFVILNLSGEFPLADKQTGAGRVLASFTAVMSVAIFAIPTGLVGAALEGAIAALNSGDEKDYDVDDEDAAEIAELANEAKETVIVPAFTLTGWYKNMTGLVIVVNATCAVLGTIKAVQFALEGSLVAWALFHFVPIATAIFFLTEHACRISAAGLAPSFRSLASGVALVDLLCWLPQFMWLCYTGFFEGSFPSWITLSTALASMLKFERYVHGFAILNKVVQRSGGVLAVGGMAAAVLVVFCSALMYYAERNNPDPHMRKYYSSVPMSMWMTLLNMSGEAPLCDYTLPGRFIVGLLSITATAIFAIPVGAIGAGFEGVVGEIANAQKADVEEEGAPLLPISDTTGSKYGSSDQSKVSAEQKNKNETREASHRIPMNGFQRLVDGRGTRGHTFVTLSLIVTISAVLLEILSTVDYGEKQAFATTIIERSELVVVLWFSFEFIVRCCADGWDYVFSWLGAVDIFATFPYYLAQGLIGPNIATTMNIYDGPLRALRILRLVRLDAYAPSLTLVDDALRECWRGLSVALFAGAIIWFLFNEILYFAERDDEDEGENKRFRNALSSLQYSGVLLTGDYPIVDFSLWGKLACCCAVIVAVGIVAVPASILAGAFVDLLNEQAEKRRQERFEAASKMQNIFLRRKAQKEVSKRASSVNAPSSLIQKFQEVTREAIRHSETLRGLDSSNPTWAAKLCIWKNNKGDNLDSCISGKQFSSFMSWLIVANILAVVLESIPDAEMLISHDLWQWFETLSVALFSAEYAMNIIVARYDPKWGFSRVAFITSFGGIADLISVAPLYLELVSPLLWGASGFQVDATIFRIARMARILESEELFSQFTMLGDVFSKAGPVLKATGVLALIVWVGGATAFYYTSPHADIADGDESWAQGGEDAAVFTSIVDALYYTSIFMAGEWCVVDFTPLGSVICTVLAMIGVALFSIPVGVLFEGFQDMLTEKHGGA
jgi:hypothetical protein